MIIIWIWASVTLGIVVLGIGIAVWHWWRADRESRRRRAAVYSAEPVDTHDLFSLRLGVQPPPVQPAPIRPRPREPETAADEWPRPARTPTFSPDLRLKKR